MRLSQTIFRWILWAGFLFATPCAICAQNAIQQKKDSLYQALTTTEGKEKINAYVHLTEIYFHEVGDDLKKDTLFALYDEMDAEAVRQNNIKIRGSILAKRSAAHLNTLMFDEVVKCSPDYLSFLEKNELWRAYYQTYSFLIDAYRRKGESEQAIRQAEIMYDHAKEREDVEGMGTSLYNLSKIYGSIRRFAESEKCLRECIELLKNGPAKSNLLINVYYNLGESLIAQKRYDDALQVVAESEELILRLEEEANQPLQSSWINVWLSYCGIYRQLGAYDKAEIYLNKIDSVTNGNHKMYDVRAQILYGKGEYNKALEMINKGLDERPNDMGAIGIKLMILIEMGEADDGYNLFRNVIIRMDSVNNAKFNVSLNQLRTQYEVDKHIAEKERNRNYFLFALGGCLLLLLLLGGVVYYNRKITKKNHSLYKQINERNQLDKKAEEAKAQISPQKLTREQKLYMNLQRLMQTEKLFIDPELDRDKLAERLNTNRQYLTDSIKKENGLAFGQYLTEMRLKYALELLSDDFDMSLESIASESGHRSYSAFFRAFTQKYGMSPSEYRKFSQNTSINPA